MEPSGGENRLEADSLESQLLIDRRTDNSHKVSTVWPSNLLYVHDQMSNFSGQLNRKLQQDFLWNGRSMENKFHLVDWKSVCKSKLEGGLGFRPETLMNQALLGKWLWRLGNETEGLWRQLVLAKYGRIKRGL
eukprot:TRINITY_DN11181_c2_g1_i1.p1 TRINITY_DN11181_c2_g1~~TRINITY_DN11181_c2_g1_i1.p1  ORF type:complete len:133 (-),score=22.23 TRINITY_DN11181_c2_g1_i1:799-1197(-)